MSGPEGAGGGHSGGAGGSDAFRSSPGLSEADLRHQDVMRAVVGRMQDTPYVLKGGTALLLAHDLPRPSIGVLWPAGSNSAQHGRGPGKVSLRWF